MPRVRRHRNNSTPPRRIPTGKQDLQKLDDMEKQSLERLYDFQHGDGGWGWWKEGESDHWMTAYVVWGLSLARDAGIEVKEDVLRRGADYLDKQLVEEEENPDMQAWMLHALRRITRRSRNQAIERNSRPRRRTIFGPTATSSTPTPARCSP